MSVLQWSGISESWFFQIIGIHLHRITAEHAPRVSHCWTFAKGKSALNTHWGQVKAEQSQMASHSWMALRVSYCWTLTKDKSLLNTHQGQVTVKHSPRASHCWTLTKCKSLLNTHQGQVIAEHLPRANPPCCRQPHPGTAGSPLWCAPGLTWARCGRRETAALPLASATPWTGNTRKSPVQFMHMHREPPCKLLCLCIENYHINCQVIGPHQISFLLQVRHEGINSEEDNMLCYIHTGVLMYFTCQIFFTSSVFFSPVL